MDDHPMMRDGLRSTIELENDMSVIGEAVDGAQAIEMYAALRPDVTLLDLQMPNVDGLQALTAIRKSQPNASVVVFTIYPGDARVTQALTLGATSYLLKSASSEEIIGAIRKAASGRQVIASEISSELANYHGSAVLTVRELNVLRLAKEGMSNRLIAESLFIAEDTVKSHMKSILAKLGASDRTHAVTIAERRGFIDP
ncbi:response regulator transcription factor [Rhodanobacter sp. C05]|uniref:response regulator n=1 Tax=Rhodanobacter sp. C05 TaxID=1945855 RepID=UPI00210F38ED|nr:response regulator transcription factor [Rhodanobacter sp. C05]